jgi:hypothetical protein
VRGMKEKVWGSKEGGGMRERKERKERKEGEGVEEIKEREE